MIESPHISDFIQLTSTNWQKTPLATSKIPTLTFRDPPPDGVLPFEIASFEQLIPLAQSKRPHRHHFFEILHITAGQGKHIIDFDVYPLQPPSVFFISPGQVHFYQRETPISGHALLFTEDFLLSTIGDGDSFQKFDFFYSVLQSPVLRLSPDEIAPITRLIDEIYAEYASNDDHRRSALQAYLLILLVKFQRLFTSRIQKSSLDHKQTMVHQFKELVTKNFLTKRAVQFYADQIGLSPSHLAATVKDITGETPGQIIRKTVVLEAKRLLIHTDQTIEQISHLLNFKDPPYFGRFFKREVGQTPCEFRNQIREKYQFS